MTKTRTKGAVRARYVYFTLFLSLPGMAGAEPASARALPSRDRGAGPGLVVPAAHDGPSRAVVLLHGVCGEPKNSCPVFGEAARSAGWLVCVRADTECPGGGASWSFGLASRARIEGAVGAAQQASGGAVDGARPRLLLAFSQGAYLAPQLAREVPGRYPAMVLVGARVRLTADSLRAAGVRRVVLAAGELDGAAPDMRESARVLAIAGVDVRWVSLGRVGHTYHADPPERLDGAIAWAAEGLP